MRLYLLSAAACGRINERKSNMKSLVFALAAVAVSAAFAEGPKMRRQSPAESMNPIIRAVQNPKIAAKLGLSEEQAAKLKKRAADINRVRAKMHRCFKTFHISRRSKKFGSFHQKNLRYF